MKSNYISTYLGNRFFPLEPRIDDIDIEDIAHGLAYQCRFNGQTRTFYSVAQHSVFVSDLVPDELKPAALLHDAAEAYLGDMVKPLKLLLPEFSRIEDRVTEIIGERFGVDLQHHPVTKQADLIALATEKRDLMPFSTEDWSSLTGVEPVEEKLAPLQPEQAKRVFLAAFERLFLK
jgi:5'-deoxynucleotidase YfbR-like HD superfamily hydrolase